MYQLVLKNFSNFSCCCTNCCCCNCMLACNILVNQTICSNFFFLIKNDNTSTRRKIRPQKRYFVIQLHGKKQKQKKTKTQFFLTKNKIEQKDLFSNNVHVRILLFFRKVAIFFNVVTSLNPVLSQTTGFLLLTENRKDTF